MKIKLIVCFLSFFYLSVYSQCVSVEMSIDWKNSSKVYKDSFGTQCIPFLKVTYRNNTQDSIYFLKPIRNDGSINFLSPTIDNKKFNKQKIPDYLNCKFQVLLFNNPYSNWSCGIISDSLIHNDSIEREKINDEMFDTYKYIWNISKIDEVESRNTKLSFDFNSKDINENGISTKLREQFCFLKPDEIEVVEFSLIGFWLFKGVYTFTISTTTLFNFVYTDPNWSSSLNKWIFDKTQLPNKVSKYKLYCGEVCTNSIILSINK